MCALNTEIFKIHEEKTDRNERIYTLKSGYIYSNKAKSYFQIYIKSDYTFTK